MKKDFRVVSAKFLDAQGNINQYLFSNSELNPKLKAELFIFSIPTGVKVILPVTPGESHNAEMKLLGKGLLEKVFLEILFKNFYAVKKSFLGKFRTKKGKL